MYVVFGGNMKAQLLHKSRIFGIFGIVGFSALLSACTVGLVDTTKPVSEDTAVVDTADTTDTTDTNTTDTTDTTDTNTHPNYENPYNGECSDNLDNDGDGRVDCNDSDCASSPDCNTTQNGDADSDGYPDAQDCNPYNPYVNPGAAEVPNNGIDDNCDGITDSGNNGGNGGNGGSGGTQQGVRCSNTCTDGLGGLLYGANDGKCQDGGFGDFFALALGESLCAFGTDCNDCGSRIDMDNDLHEADPSGLGLGLALFFDCDDNNPNINSSATDIAGNGVDEDCDGSDATSTPTHPSTETSCTNGIDDDQDGSIDCGDSDCANNSACTSTTPSTETNCINGVDDDQDGSVDCNDSDCANNSACNTPTTCPNGQTSDCHGLCVPTSWLGDGVCDHNVNNPNNTYGLYSLNCSALNYDNGDCPNSSACSTGYIVDCDGQCSDESYLGDGSCDDGSYYYENFNCQQWFFDNNDCP
jgi:hypothetical protein